MTTLEPIRALPKTFSVQVLTTEQVQRVHAGALEILERTGVSTTSDRLLELMADNGQQVDFKARRIRLSPDFVESKRALAPRTFTLAGRTPDRDLVIDGTRGYLSPDGCAPQILDMDTGERRSSTKADLGQLARIADALPEIGFMWRSVSAGDQKAEARSLHEMEVLFNNTTKHLQTGSGNHAFSSRGVVELCRTVGGGAEELRARPNLSSIQCIISPLFWDDGPIEAIANYAEAGIPISLTSMAMACATAPATMAGLVTLTIAELLSGVAILQTLQPGAKAVCASYAATMDLYSGALNLAAGPDDPFATMACTQVIEALDLPSASTTFGSGAKRSNWQAGVQTALSAAKTAFVPADLFSGAGGLYASNVFSPAQMLLDCEVFGAVARWAEGYPFDDEHIGLDTIDTVGPAEHFLGEQHTLDHMRELWRSRYMDRSSWEEWQAIGEPDPESMALAEAKRILAEHEPEPLDEALIAELAAIVAAYEAEALENPEA
jgi:trimethylamine--corrinoid protein Co-methyltransferase